MGSISMLLGIHRESLTQRSLFKLSLKIPHEHCLDLYLKMLQNSLKDGTWKTKSTKKEKKKVCSLKGQELMFYIQISYSS